MDKLDTDLYSRQIFTYGIDIMKKIINLKILLIGLRGLGIEIAKNLVLSGPKLLSISDKNICRINDLGSNFYINESDVNNLTREEACYEKLISLNPYVDITINNGNIKENIREYNLIIITEILKINELYEINEICRKYNIGFIYTLNLGLTGFLFNDFGINHIINDINGEQNLNYNIFNIEEKGKNYEIFLDLKKNEYFNLKKGDYIIFKDVKGLEFLNDGIPRQIKNSSRKSFEIENNNISRNNRYINNGIIEEVKIPKQLKFQSFQYSLENPDDKQLNIDTSKANSNVLLHCAFVGLHKFYSLKNKLPDLNNSNEIDEILKFSHQFYLEMKKKNISWLKNKRKNKEIEFDKLYIAKVIKWSKCEINPFCAFLGGIVSQEAIKITGKYNPIYQWLRFDFFEIIDNIPNNCNRELLNNRYDDQIAIFGQEFQSKLEKLNIFLIGAGALGCEYLKNLALMGIACNKRNKNFITVTDNDNIVFSNLNRQFLFKKKDIGESKSTCSFREVKKMNKDINIKPYQYLVSNETREIFNDFFWEKQDIIISAVDNMTARKYIDNQCTFYNKILLDSGTQGTLANTDIYYPKKTICLNDLKFNTKKKIPICTLKNFPTRIEHCIEWAKLLFIELFEQYINELKLIINDRIKFINLLNEDMKIRELYLKIEIFKYYFYIIDNPSQHLIIKFAFFIFEFYFNYNIKMLLLENSKYFGNEYNKKPSSIILDLNDVDTILYFKYFYFLLSNIVKCNEIIDDEKIKLVISQEKILTDREFNKNELITDFKKEIYDKIDKNLNNIKEKINLINPIQFEKDNDINNHINFILSLTNLRAKNYNIKKCDFLKAKEISGNIIPAIASTTASITGLSCLQIYTLIQTDNINYLRSGAINLGTSEFDLFIPEEKRYLKDIKQSGTNPGYKTIPKDFTVWDKIDLYGPNMTIKALIDFFKNKYDVDIEYINYNNNIILASPIEGNEDYNKTIEELIIEKTSLNINDNTKYIKIQISGTIKILQKDQFVENEVLTPTIRYILKK